MSYSNITVVTAQGTFGYQPGTPFVPISYNTLDLIPEIPHNAQLEVERIFSIDRNGDTNAIPNFLNNTNVSVVDKQRVFIIPTDRITYNTTTKQITNVLLPSSGTDVYNYTFTYISGPNAGQTGTIAVPALTLGDNIIIRRKTVSNTPLVLWTAGSKLTTAQLNLNTTQLLYLIQELNNKITITSVSTEQILDNAITTAKILNGAVTSDKLFDLGGPKRLLGSGNVSANADGKYDVQELTLGDGFYWDANSTVLQVADIETGIKGDINVIVPRTNWRIIDNAVTYAKLQDVTASRLLGRGSSGTGDPQELTVANNLTISGTQLAVTTPLTDGNKGDVDVSGNGTVFTLTNNSVDTAQITDRAVTYAKMQNMSAIGNRVLGTVAGSEPPQEVQVNTNMLAAQAVTNEKLAFNSVGSNNIQANAVVTAGIANNAVTYDKMRTVATANRVLGSTSSNGTVSEVQIATDMIANNAVSFAKMQQVATNTLLGRASAGTGNVETITITAAGRDLIDEASVADMRQYLQLGTAALSSTAEFAAATHTHGNISSTGAVGSTANLPLITGTSGVIQTGSFGTVANTFCQGNDARLSDARTPTAHGHTIGEITDLQSTLDGKAASSHTHIIDNITGLQTALNGKLDTTGTLPLANITGAGTAASKDVAVSGNASSTQVVMGNDTRLTDARTPTSHTHSTSDITSGTLAVARGGTGVSSTPSSGQLLIGDNTGFTLATLTAGTNIAISNTAGGITISQVGEPVAPSALLADGTYGDINISGNTWTVVNNAISTAKVANDAITFDKIQNIATDRLLGRAAAGNGNVEEITLTAAGRNLLDDVDAAAQRTTLGLGSAATEASTAFAAASHTHGNITNAGAIGGTANLPIITTTSGVLTTGSFGTAANTFCQGNDVRLSDARTPLSHTHGNISNAGAIGTTANLPIITTTSGVLTAGAFGSTANTFCQGNDSRLSDTRTPTDNTVSTAKIQNSAVTADKLATDSVTAVKIADVNVTTAKLANGAVTSDKIANGAVTYAKLPTIVTADRVLGSTVAGGTVGEVQITAGMLQDGLVTTTKIADGNVTAAKLASGVAAANLGNLGVTTALLADNAVTTAKITDLNVTTGKLANNAVTYGKMQVVAGANRLLGSTTAGGAVSEVQVATDMVLDSAITTAKVNNAAITADKLGSNAVTTAKILDRNVTFPKLPASVTANRVLGATTSGTDYAEVQVNTNMIADGAITAAKIAAGAVTFSASDLADGSITANKLATDSVTEVKIQNAAVTNAKISNRAGNSIMGRSASTAGSVADIVPTVSGQVLRYDGTTTEFGTVGTTGIADGAITTAKIGDAQITGAKILDGTITSNKLTGTIPEGFLPSSVKYNYFAGVALTGSEVFITGIPAEANKIFIEIWSMSFSGGAPNLYLKVGNSSILSSGYSNSAARFREGVQTFLIGSTTSFVVNTEISSSSSSNYFGTLTLRRIHPNSAGWIMSGELCNGTMGTLSKTVGSITIPSGLHITQISLSPSTNNFDNGSAYVWWEA